MNPEHILALRASVIAAGFKAGTFVEYLDDDGTQQVVTGVVERNGEMVATLAGGEFVTLCDNEVAACDFRTVSPAIPPECPGRDCERCPLKPVCPEWAALHKLDTPGVLVGMDTLPGYDQKTPLPTVG